MKGALAMRTPNTRTQKNKSKGGRPLLPDHLARTFKKTTNLNASELKKLSTHAKQAGLSVSQYLRSVALSPKMADNSPATTAALNAIAGELNTIASRAAGAGNPLSQAEAAELISLHQALIKRLSQLKQTLEGEK